MVTRPFLVTTPIFFRSCPQRKKFCFKNWEKMPGQHFFNEKVESCWIMMNYRQVTLQNPPFIKIIWIQYPLVHISICNIGLQTWVAFVELVVFVGQTSDTSRASGWTGTVGDKLPGYCLPAGTSTRLIFFKKKFYQMINYEDFIKVKEQTGEKCKNFFTATIFSKLYHNDPFGR